MAGAPQAGSVLDHYRLLEQLGEGGMGVVWLAEDTRLGRQVAIKFLPADAATDPSRRQRFEQEARAAAALSHPGIATVHELAEFEGQMYIVFERVQGTTLRSLLTSSGIPRDELLDIAVGIADALAAAHAAGVVHRDLKPENVMRTPAGPCKVLDFGLARLTAAAQSLDSLTRSNLTAAGTVVGTVGYMAPEQLEGKDVDFRGDVFSFGTLLYELATGIHPFAGDSPASTIAAIMTAEPLPLTQRNQLQPAELERIVRKCLRKRRDERYQSTRDLAVDLRELRRELSGGAPAAPAASTLPFAEDRLQSSSSMGRRWWWVHQLSGMFIITPLVIYLLWKAHGFLPSQWRLTASLAATCFLALNWNVRLALIIAAIGNPVDLAARIRRLRLWVHWTGWPFVALLAVITFLVAPQSEFWAIWLAIMTTGGVVSLAILEPFIARAAFPSSGIAPAAPAPKAVTARTWWGLHAIGTLCLGVPGTIYLAWLAAAALDRSWAHAVMVEVFIAAAVLTVMRGLLVCFLVFVPGDAGRQAWRVTPWERGVAIAVFAGMVALGISLFAGHAGLAALVLVWSVLCLMATQFVAPAIDEVVFPR